VIIFLTEGNWDQFKLVKPDQNRSNTVKTVINHWLGCFTVKQSLIALVKTVKNKPVSLSNGQNGLTACAY